MTLGTVTKTPADVLDYEIDFSIWLPDGDRITVATATIDAGTTALAQTDFSDTQVRVWISGGTMGDSGEVEVTATTAGGRTKTECFRLKVQGC